MPGTVVETLEPKSASEVAEDNYGITDEKAEERPRDEHGRFIKAEEVVEGEEAVVETGVEVVEAKEEAPPEITAGLALEDDAPPTFDHDGKFVGGKFLGKYDTLDDQLVGHKNALKRIGQLEHENAQLKVGGVKTNETPPEYFYDPYVITPEQIAKIAAQELGIGEELTAEQYAEHDRNPVLFNAKISRKVDEVKERITTAANHWKNVTREAFEADPGNGGVNAVPGLFDRVIGQGEIVWRDFRRGVLGPSELRVLLGAGLEYRQILSQSKNKAPLAPKKPVGRAPETAASVTVKPKPKPGPSDDETELAAMQHAAYG